MEVNERNVITIVDHQQEQAVRQPSLLNRIADRISSMFRKRLPTSESQMISADARMMINQLPPEIHPTFSRRVDGINSGELFIGQYLRENLDLDENRQTAFEEILKGAYVMIDDGGETYRTWVQNLRDRIHERQSSHASDNVQYAIRGSVVSELLFSTKTVEDPTTGERKTYTWFQIERYPMKFGYAIRHLWCWVLYKITGKNQGAYGSTIHRETSNPLLYRLVRQLSTSNLS